jgi:hypothetical protein
MLKPIAAAHTPGGTTRDERRNPMTNITRLALAFAVATIAALSPMAHADDEAQLVAPGGGGIQQERYYTYQDKDGYGELVVKDGPKYPWGRPIYVTLYQNGYVFHGEGKRSLASDDTYWLAECWFWLYGSGTKAKFEGYLPIKQGYEPGYGYYYYNGFGPGYEWECYFEEA